MKKELKERLEKLRHDAYDLANDFAIDGEEYKGMAGDLHEIANKIIPMLKATPEEIELRQAIRVGNHINKLFEIASGKRSITDL